MQLNKKLCLREELERMPQAELKEMLHAELAREESDGEQVRVILQILQDRRKTPAEGDTAWESYKAHVESRCQAVKRKRRRNGWLKAGIVAMVFLLLVVSVPRAAGAGNIVEFVKMVRDDAVAFFSPSQPDNRVEFEYRTSHAGLQLVNDEVRAAGITEQVVPSWVPEEYELVELKTEIGPSKTRIYARLASAKNAMVLMYERYGTATTHEFLRDETQAGEYECGGVIHKKYNNMEKHYALWSRDNLKCSIVVDCQAEILDEILRSIYIMEDV